MARLARQSAQGRRQATWRRSKRVSQRRRTMARGSRDPCQRLRADERARASPSTRCGMLKRRRPKHRFIWLLGSDTLPNFHLWRDWRGLAREVPIAVICRPGYDLAAHAARAMGWLGRFVHPSSQASHWTDWSAPAIVFLRLPPDHDVRHGHPHARPRLAPPNENARPRVAIVTARQCPQETP